MLRLAKAALLGSTVLFLSACGDNPLANAFQNISIKNLDQDGNAIVELKTEVGVGSVLFTSGNLPIIDPKTGKIYGSISMERTLDGKNILTVSANVTSIKLGNVLTDNKLPNGDNVPIAGLTSLVAVPAGRHSRIYIGQSGDKVMLGVAVAIEQFDSLSKYIPGVSMFFNVKTNNELPGVAGFFTSAESGKSGLAMFMQTNIPGINLPSSNVIASTKMSSSSLESGEMRFLTRNATSEQANYFGYYVNKWKTSKTKLKVK